MGDTGLALDGQRELPSHPAGRVRLTWTVPGAGWGVAWRASGAPCTPPAERGWWNELAGRDADARAPGPVSSMPVMVRWVGGP
ncbi:hypothetical protein [Amycolatopsis arida]|uniref:hypothetical protein n=1 Tax=Amycolatopsis arida TaxID=587909 RepID=UPI000B896BDC|nr:hypothetical protein [Amycolatopsis arida]